MSAPPPKDGGAPSSAPAAPVPSSARPGEWEPPVTFDDFEIIRPLGHGGMGRVYLAHDAVLDRPVAIKFIVSQTQDQRVHDRFLVEARSIARLQHPNVVAIFRIGVVEKRPYLAYEFVAGEGLDELEKPVLWQAALAIALGLGRGLAAAHRGGVLHRDIKPANAILARTGDVKLIDFGIAKLIHESRQQAATREELQALEEAPTVDEAPPFLGTADTALLQAMQSGGLTDTHAVLGTPLYLAPEIWNGSAATPRSDIYSFGLLLYELCAGRLPTAAFDIPSLAKHARTQDLPSVRSTAPAVPQVFAEVIDRCVRRAPDERSATADELLEALESADAICRVFQLVRSSPSSPPPAMAPAPAQDDAALVTASFARISDRADALVARFYERLFQEAPAIRGLFPQDMSELREKLASALKLSVENLRRPDILVPMLEELGRRHASYSAEPAHFDTVGRALLGALAEIDQGFDDAVELSWGRAYAQIAEAMVRGLREGQLASGDARTDSINMNPGGSSQGAA
jgi:serine/threonine protein kinase